MKIALVAPLYEAVPPKFYGGTERVVAYLADELVELGHDVTLFASAESRTRARLVPCRDQAIRLDPTSFNSDVAAHFTMLDQVRARAHEFDILHFHAELFPFPMFEELAGRTVTTLHGRLDLKDLRDFYRRWHQYPLVSISNSQRGPMSEANWLGTVYHGLPTNLYTPAKGKPAGDYVAFLGRISPEKQPDVAIRIAQRMGRHLKIAAKVDKADTAYFKNCIEPLLNDSTVEFIGEVNDKAKNVFLSEAEALLVPVNWPEPFGIVMIEAMACGTPVIAFRCGSIPEVIEDGVTGYIVANEEEAVTALNRVHQLDRRRIRAEFERRFCARVMAQNYVEIYQRALSRHSQQRHLAVESAQVPATAATVQAPASQPAQTNPAPAGDPANHMTQGTVESDESRMPYKLFALKHLDCFAVADSFGDIVGKGDGVFRDDTRVLSEFRLLLGDKPLSLLTATISQDNVFFTSHVTNRPLPPLGERSIPEGVIHIKRTRFLWEERLYERLQLVNYAEEDVYAPIRYYYNADFKDMFEVRGMQRKARGQMLPIERTEHQVMLRYRGLDAKVRQSVIAFSENPTSMTDNTANFTLFLPCNRTVEFYIEVGPDKTDRPSRTRFRTMAARARRSMRRRGHAGGTLRSSERIFNNWLEKSRADLALLTTDLPTGPYPYAGIPWFSTPFGRDAVITAMQMLWFDPGIARGVLNFLAQNQAQEFSTFKDAAPGKIMHETRKSEMNSLKEIPFALYYGGVDTTPLFVMLAGAYAQRTGDMAFIEKIWPALEAATTWIETIGDSNGDGFLDYASGEATGLRNQGWKDSEDSVFYENGEFPRGPIALVEVQGYKYAALMAMAKLSQTRGQEDKSVRWRDRAELLRKAVEQHFWMEDRSFYGLALDGEGHLCRVRASNAGHLLFTGLPSPDRAAQVTQQLLSSTFDSGWGIRTLATDEHRFNPMSYHNGSVWPHDTAICAAGMARYGERGAAAHILSELFDAAVFFGMRLPELFCGFQRAPGDSPIAYPVACLPQAWASGSLFMTLQACLGISIDGWRKEICIDDPQLPSGINHLAIKGVQVGDGRVDLVFQRVRDRVAVFTSSAKNSDVRVLTRI